MNGVKHLFLMVKQTNKELDEVAKTIVNKVFQRNAFFLHPENLLLSMINDEQRNM